MTLTREVAGAWVERLGVNDLMLGRNQLFLYFDPVFPLVNLFIVTEVSNKPERYNAERRCLPLATVSTVNK